MPRPSPQPKPLARAPRRPPADLAPYAKLFKALGDETRLEMLALLRGAHGELCVCEIESHFDLAQPTVSHHLRILREAGLAVAERRGTWMYYALAPRALVQIESFLAHLRA